MEECIDYNLKFIRVEALKIQECYTFLINNFLYIRKKLKFLLINSSLIVKYV